MYKIIIVFLLSVTTVRLKRIDSIEKFRLGTFNVMGAVVICNVSDPEKLDAYVRYILSSSGIEYPSSNNGVTSRSARLTRAKRTPLMYLVPVNEEYENADNEMTERSRPSRKIKRCKTALCKAENIPLSGEYGDGMVKATAGESSGEPYGRPTRWKQIRTAKNSVISKLFKKETDSNESGKNTGGLFGSLRKNLVNEQNYDNYSSNRKYREKLGKFVCYCEKESCPDCRSSDSRKELIGAPRTGENTLGKDKFKKDKYRKLLRPNDYAIPKMPLVSLPELHREIPYDLRRNRGNTKKMDVLPIVRRIPPNVHPLTAPFRVAYDPVNSYLGTSGPISQRYQQSNNIYQHVPLKQYTVASKSKSDIPLRRPSISMPGNDDVGSRNNENGKDFKSVNPEVIIDSNMQECIKLFGKKVCVLAASTNCHNLNKVQSQDDSNFFMGSNRNVGSACNYYEASSTEESSTFHGVNEDMISNDPPYNIINEEDIDDDRISTEQQSLETPEYVTIGIDNDEIFNDYDSTEASILGVASNQKEETTTILYDTSSYNNVKYNYLYDIENKPLKQETESSNRSDYLDNLSNSIGKVGNEKSNDTIYDDDNYDDVLNDFSSSTTKVKDEKSTDPMIPTSENESTTYDSRNQYSHYYDDFASIKTFEDKTSTDTILGDDGNYYTKETHPGLDYSDIQVVTNGYFTSKGHDGYDENYFTGLDPSTHDYHRLPNEGTINFLENPPSYDTNLEATNIPGIIKDRSNSLSVSPTRSYSDLAKSRFFTDSSINNYLNIEETTTKDVSDLLEKEPINCERKVEHKVNDQRKESALEDGKIETATFIATNSVPESQRTTTNSFLGYAIHSSNYITNNIASSDYPTSFEISAPIESTENLTESGDVVTIDDYAVREAILTTDKNSIERQFLEDVIDNDETTATLTTLYDENLDSTVRYLTNLGWESTNSMINEENSSKDLDTTSNAITNDDKIFYSRSGKDGNVLKNFQAESTTQHLPFCDNAVLINSIRKVINNFTMNSASLEEPYVSTDIPNEELSPEILEIPNLRSFLSLPQIENVIVKNVKDHLSKFAGLSKNALAGARPGEAIRNTLRNILGVLPKTQPELPPMAVVEHQFQNDEWTTNLVTLVPDKRNFSNQNSLQKIHEHIENLIYNPAVGLEAAKQNAVQNIIVQAVKHQIENANGEAVGEDRIRDMFGNILGNAFEEGQDENKEDSSMDDTTKQLEEQNNYDESTTMEDWNVLEDFYKNFQQVPADLSNDSKYSNDNETTTDLTIKLYTTDFIGNRQISPSLSKEKSANCLKQGDSVQVETTTASFTKDFVGSVKFSSTDINKETNDFDTNENLEKKEPIGSANRVNPEPVTTAIPIKSNITDVEITTASYTESYPEFSIAQINQEENSIDGPNLCESQSIGYSSDLNSEQATTTVPVIIANRINNIESATISEFSSVEIDGKNNDSNLGKEQSNNYPRFINFSTTTNSYIKIGQEDKNTESTNISETTKDVTNINEEETTVGVPYGDQQRSSETTRKNKGETNESEVRRLPQNSFVGAGNTGTEGSSSANQGRSSQGKEKCRLCKMESCSSTHEIVTKVRKRVKTTTKKYYGAKENVVSEGNPIGSSKHQGEDRSTIVSLESQEDVNRSNDHDDEISTTCENLSVENLQDPGPDEDMVYEEKISMKNTYGDDEDDLSDLQNSELYYIGDNVKLPLEIKKLKDGSYALSISKSICENVLKRKCPCCVPLDGNVRSVKRSPTIYGNTGRVARKRKSPSFKSEPSRKRSRRSTITNKGSNSNESILKNELKTLTMPVMTFAKKYNLRLNLDDAQIENTTADQIKRANRIGRDNIDAGSRERLIERPNEITRDKNVFEERNCIHRNDDDRLENINTNNPVFQRMKFINRMRQNPELYRRQRDIDAIPNDKIEILKGLLNSLRSLILH